VGSRAIDSIGRPTASKGELHMDVRLANCRLCAVIPCRATRVQVTVQMDWHNAFYTLPRDQNLAAVEQRCPALLPIVGIWQAQLPPRPLIPRGRGLIVERNRATPSDRCKGHLQRSQQWTWHMYSRRPRQSMPSCKAPQHPPCKPSPPSPPLQLP
jgi:hypothetical protein